MLSFEAKRAQATGIVIIIIFVVIFLIIALLWSGMADFAKGEKTQKAFRGGQEALALSFVDLPSRVNQNQEFYIDVLAQNMGEYPIPEGKVRVVLNNAQTFNIADPVTINPQVIKGIEDGGEVEFIYSEAKYIGSVLSEEIPQTLSIGICYPYQTTVLVRNVCLAPSNTNTLCEPMGEKEVESSGAPVHLNSFKQLSSVYNTGEEYIDLIIKLEFEKKGPGDIYYLPTVGCSSLTAGALNNLRISSMKLGTEEINIFNSCGTNIISLSATEGRTTGSLRCTIRQKGIITDAKSILTITLEYLHSQQLKGSIRVMPV